MAFPGGTGYLGDILDVTIASPLSGNLLEYDGTGWRNITPLPIEVTDVAELDWLVYDASQGAFVNTGNFPLEIDDLSDITISSGVTSGDVMTYDGNEWVNIPVISIDVTDGLVRGDYLVWDPTVGAFRNTGDLPEISDLETRVLRLEVQQTLLATREDISNLGQTVMTKFNTISASDDTQEEKLDILIAGFTSLKNSINDLETLFYAHTGLSGAHTW
jgi:hypothetical protein